MVSDLRIPTEEGKFGKFPWSGIRRQPEAFEVLRDEDLRRDMSELTRPRQLLSPHELYPDKIESEGGVSRWLSGNCRFASMSLYVADADTGEAPPKDMMDMSSRLQYGPAAGQISKMMSDEEREAWGASRPVEMFSPDGDDHFEESGTLNWYVHGLPPEKLPQMESAVKYYLDELGVKYGPFKYETFGEYLDAHDPKEINPEWAERDKSKAQEYRVARIPILQLPPPAPPGQHPPELNMSNANARDVFEGLLNFSGAMDGAPMDAWQILQRIGGLIESQKQEYVSEPSQEGNVYHQGRDEGYIDRRLEDIAKVAQWAVDNGHQQLYLA